MDNEDNLKECIEDSLQNFYKIFGKQPSEANAELALFHKELKEEYELLSVHLSKEKYLREELAVRIHGMKSMLSVFGFEMIVEEAEALLTMLRNTNAEINRNDFDYLLNNVATLLKQLHR